MRHFFFRMNLNMTPSGFTDTYQSHLKIIEHTEDGSLVHKPSMHRVLLHASQASLLGWLINNKQFRGGGLVIKFTKLECPRLERRALKTCCQHQIKKFRGLSFQLSVPTATTSKIKVHNFPKFWKFMELYIVYCKFTKPKEEPKPRFILLANVHVIWILASQARNE